MDRLTTDEKPTLSNDESEKSGDNVDIFADIFAPTRVFSKEFKRKIRQSLQKLFFESISKRLTDQTWDFPDSDMVGTAWTDNTIITVYDYLDSPLTEIEQYVAEDENKFLIYR